MFVKFLIILLGLISAGFSQNECQTNRLNAVKSGEQLMRGTNLGSWFVIESWMAPKLWDDNGCDKNANPGSYLLEKCLGDKATDVLQQHWSTWIVEDDFVEMSKFGVNVVRVPIGWWQIYDPQGGAANASLNYYIYPADYAVGGLEYIDKALEWGEKYGIGVILDLHAAPGSQNGNDHSSPPSPGTIDWDKYDSNVGQSIDSLELYAERYANNPALVGFCLLNEPVMVDLTILQEYYKKAYERIRAHAPDVFILISPYTGPYEWGTEDHWLNFMNPDKGYTRVAMDLHYYSCFGGGSDLSDPDAAINYIKNDRLGQIKEFAERNPKMMMIGEWSACGHFSDDRAGEFAKVQADVYNTASLGWTFWSWIVTLESDNRWSLKHAFNEGWIDPIYPCDA